MFHVWGAYTALSASIGRKVWLPFGVSAIYPNIYVLLVGDAGNGKSRAMYNNRALVSQVIPEIHRTGSLETPPGLWRFMTGDPDSKPPKSSPVLQMAVWPNGMTMPTHPMFITANEFIDFISLDDKGWINALNNISDEDVYFYRTKNMGQDKVIGPYIVMFGGLTTDIAHDLQKEKIISTGLARRTIFQYGQRKFDDPHAILTMEPHEKEAFDRCLVHLNGLRRVAGAFSWDEETQKWWKVWYDDHSAKVRTRSPQTRGWFTSKPDQVLKLAILTSLSEGHSLKLETGHLEVALHFLGRMEHDLYRIFGGVGRNELAGVATQMYEFLSNLKEPISKKTLKLRLFSLFSAKNVHNEFDEALNYLVGTNKVRIHQMQLESYVDHIIALPEVLVAWAAKHSVPLASAPFDAVQRVLDSDSSVSESPSPAPSASPTPLLTGSVEPPTAVRAAPETEDDSFPTLPLE